MSQSAPITTATLYAFMGAIIALACIVAFFVMSIGLGLIYSFLGDIAQGDLSWAQRRHDREDYILMALTPFCMFLLVLVFSRVANLFSNS